MTVRTTGDVGAAVRQAMARERRRLDGPTRPTRQPRPKAVKPEPVEVVEEVPPIDVQVEVEAVQEPQSTPEEVIPEEEELERPDGVFGSLPKWQAYRLANGYSEEEIKDLGRNKLRDLEDR